MFHNVSTTHAGAGAQESCPLTQRHCPPRYLWTRERNSPVDVRMREPRNGNHNQQIRGTVCVVADAYTWAEIFYLDSPTDYRECISVPQMTSPNDEITMLDDESCWPSLSQWRSMMKHAFARARRLLGLIGQGGPDETFRRDWISAEEQRRE